MKALLNITTCALAAACLTGSAAAQRMSFSNPSLSRGAAMKVGASYRVDQVSEGIDAVITIDGLTNIKMLNIDTPSTNGIDNAAWNPKFVGTGGNALHYADFTILFYANGTDTPLAPAHFSTTVHGNDLSDLAGGFVMEFVQVAGFSSVLTADTQMAGVDYEDGSNLASSSGDTPWLAAWDFQNKPGYTIRFGWQGNNGADTGRGFGIYVDNLSGATQNASLNASASLASAVPEPSISLFIVLSIIPLTLRRKRSK